MCTVHICHLDAQGLCILLITDGMGGCHCQLTSDPDGEIGTLSAGEEGRPLSMSKGSSRRGLFFFSVSKSLNSPEPWLWPSARVRTPDRKSAISSYRSVNEKQFYILGMFGFKGNCS